MEEKLNMRQLIKRNFIRKIVYQRLQWKYYIDDVSWDDIDNLIKAFFRMLKERDIEKDFMLHNPMTPDIFKAMTKLFIKYMKEENVISVDIEEQDIDMEYIEALLESLIYGEQMFLYCSIFAGDRLVAEIWDMPRVIRSAFVTIHYTKLLDLAMIYANTNDSKNLEGIGPKKYDQFQHYMAVDCKEYEAFEKETQGV